MKLRIRLCKKAVVCVALAMMLINGCATDRAGTTEDSVKTSTSSAQWQQIQTELPQSVAIRYFGFIDVTQDEDGESQYFEAGFARFDKTAPLSVLLDSFKQPGMNTCDFRQSAPGDSTPQVFRDELELPGYPYEFVGAGLRVDVSVGDRRYAKLKRTSTNSDDAVQYETDVGGLPLSFAGIKLGDALLKTRGLHISSDGDVFPAFSGIKVPPIDSVTKFKPGLKQAVTADTKFRWRTGRHANDPNVRVQIEAGGGGRSVFCAVADDGEFQLPEDIKTQLLNASIPNPSAYRDAIWFYLHADALLIVSQSSYY